MSRLILIPARMASTRLPGKPLAAIGDLPMIVHVANRARESNAGEIAVATDSEDVANAVANAGYRAIMTSPDHQSGSDRIREALSILDPTGRHDTILNLQGDLPAIDPRLIATAANVLEEGTADIATLGVMISEEEEKTNPNVVKIVGSPIGDKRLRALYFTRATAPWGAGPLYHHIGIYAYRRTALERFVSLGPSVLERRERLEQLRALEAGMTIDVGLVDAVPVGVDTQQDLERARALIMKKANLA